MNSTIPTLEAVTYAGLAADSAGSDDDRAPLLLLHGLTFDRRMWRPALDELARIDPDRRIVSLDLPGHGESAARDSYSMDEVVDHVHAAVVEAGLQAPVVVGHSISAVVATVYASRLPTRGVIDVDQSLQVQPMAELVQSIADRLRGPGFEAFWATSFWASMRVDVLPPPAQELVRRMSRPAQELVLAYWDDILTTPVAEMGARAAAGLAAVRAAGVPYLVIAGDEPGESYRAWLAEAVPQATIEVFPGTGHFPHLAEPERFAARLAATARTT
jgi:pimeloyl-ACP methyl ester carboxylesterase